MTVSISAPDGANSAVAVEIYPLNAVGQKLMFGARKASRARWPTGSTPTSNTACPSSLLLVPTLRVGMQRQRSALRRGRRSVPIFIPRGAWNEE
jgi:hypothetical protein